MMLLLKFTADVKVKNSVGTRAKWMKKTENPGRTWPGKEN